MTPVTTFLVRAERLGLGARQAKVGCRREAETQIKSDTPSISLSSDASGFCQRSLSIENDIVLMLGLSTPSRSCNKTDHPEYQRNHRATFRPALRAPMKDYFPCPCQVLHLAADDQPLLCQVAL
jgi:hypothetical protein